MDPYQDKKVVVIGGTHGMGFAVARRLLARGADVLLTGRDESRVRRARAELGPTAQVVRSDVSRMEEIEVLAGTVEERLGALDTILVFAGIAELSPFEDVSEAAFDRHFAVNTKGVFFTLQRLLPFVKTGGSIVLTTVTAGPASPNMSVYMATKAAVRAFAQVLAAELVGRKIRVNTLAPGFIDTPTLGLATLTDGERHAFREIGNAMTPMKRHGTVEEVASAALFLAFEATFTTGAEVPVDGGLAQLGAAET